MGKRRDELATTVLSGTSAHPDRTGEELRQTGKLLWMQCFVRAVETGSFSATARELGIGQPNVGRHVGSLESHLAVRLLHRTTRKLSLTIEGERYYLEARRALDTIAEAESVARGEDAPRGLLRISCSMVVGLLHVQPLLAPLLVRYPQLEVELHLSDEYVDLIAERFDLAVRVGTLKSSLLVLHQVSWRGGLAMAFDVVGAGENGALGNADLSRHAIAS